MIKKMVAIEREGEAVDSVELSWFDMQKPNLTAVSQKGVNFIVKAKFTHLHEGDILVGEDGYSVSVKRGKDTLYNFYFCDALTFAKTAYEIGNRHQPIEIEPLAIRVLNDISLEDIIKSCQSDASVEVEKIEDYFKPNGKAHHSH
ncbi:MAG TPA: urease accessory protein UreE [Nitratifractor sp.]|nr:urease accessory protein UreE [Nitratifractor sp.]HHH20545.1 urease accessory protein UreE [Nitratifractor sp.]